MKTWEDGKRMHVMIDPITANENKFESNWLLKFYTSKEGLSKYISNTDKKNNREEWQRQHTLSSLASDKSAQRPGQKHNFPAIFKSGTKLESSKHTVHFFEI